MAQRFELSETVSKAKNGYLSFAGASSVTVKDLAGNNLTVYSAETGSGTVSNPVTADAFGRIEGWVEAPDFDLAVSGAGITSYTQKIRQSPKGEWHVLSYGAKVDDAADDSTKVNAAVDACFSAGGGAVVFPNGTCRANIVAKPKVRLVGKGIGKTILKAPNGSNADVIKGLNFATLTGKTKATGDYALGVYEVGFENLTIDGNKDNNTTGFGIRIWGRAPIFHNVEIHSASEDGLWTEFTEVDDFGDPVQVLEGKISGNFVIHDCDGDGWTHRGPHDTTVDSYITYSNGGLGLRLEAGALDGTSYNGGVLFNYFNAFLNTGGSIYYDGSALEIRGGQIVADSSQTGLEVAATAAGNLDVNAIFAGAAAGTNTGLHLRGSSHRISGSVLRLGTGIKLDGAINCNIDVTASANTTFLNNISETGPNFIKALVDVPAAGALKSGAAFNSGGHYFMRGYGAGGNFYEQQFPSQTLKAGGWSPVLPNSFGVLVASGAETIASAASIALTQDATLVTITGTTNIGTITAKPAGTVITLVFAGALSMLVSGNLLLAGGVNFVTSTNDTLTLVSNGTNWYEVARSVN